MKKLIRKYLKITLEDLILVIGGFVHRGGTTDEIEIELLLRLQELTEQEIEERLTGIPKGEIIH